MDGSKTNITNTILMTVIGLLVGAIGGYLIGRGDAPQTVATSSPVQSTAVNCPHELNPADTYILTGFRCPATDSVQAALLTCHCTTAHAIKDRVKAELAAGKTGDQIHQELIAEYGDRLKFIGQ